MCGAFGKECGYFVVVTEKGCSVVVEEEGSNLAKKE